MRFGVRRRNGVWETTSINDASLHELHPARRTALDRILDSTSRSTLLLVVQADCLCSERRRPTSA